MDVWINLKRMRRRGTNCRCVEKYKEEEEEREWIVVERRQGCWMCG